MNINNDIERVLISNDELIKRISEIAEIINKDYKNTVPVLICILKGSVNYFSRLCEFINIPMEYEFLRASSYEGCDSTGKVKLLYKPTTSFDNRDLIIVEDIIDTGNSLQAIKEVLKDYNPKSVKITTLLDKPSRRVVDVDVDYVGFVIPDEFVVGYGLDFNERYRNLPYIGVLKKELYK